MATVTETKADKAVESSKPEDKEDKKERVNGKKSGKGRKPKVAFPVPEAGLKEAEVKGFDRTIHQPLTVADFAGDEVLWLRHKQWLCDVEKDELQKRIDSLEKFAPELRSSVQSLLSDFGKVGSALVSARNAAASAKDLTDEQRAEQDELLKEEVLALAQSLLAKK